MSTDFAKNGLMINSKTIITVKQWSLYPKYTVKSIQISVPFFETRPPVYLRYLYPSFSKRFMVFILHVTRQSLVEHVHLLPRLFHHSMDLCHIIDTIRVKEMVLISDGIASSLHSATGMY